MTDVVQVKVVRVPVMVHSVPSVGALITTCVTATGSSPASAFATLPFTTNCRCANTKV